MRALVIGEALIDVVERDGRRIGEHVGGSPLNVAVGLARLGRPVDFQTHIGTDDYGHRIEDFVESAGVQLVPGSTNAASTATALATLDEAGAATYSFDIDWQLSGTPQVAPPSVVHSGSIATVLEPGCLATAALVDTYHLSATFTFDPNIRPALIPDADAARERIDRMIEKADVIKASDEDLRWIDPGRPPEQTAASWLASGAKVVVVTLGGEGAVAMCAAGTVRVPAPDVHVVDTVGAGDSFMAGLIDALWARDLLGAEHRPALAHIDRETLSGVVRTAARCAAVTVSRAGADLPNRATLDAANSSDILD